MRHRWEAALIAAQTGAGARVVATTATLPAYYIGLRLLVVALAAALLVKQGGMIIRRLAADLGMVAFFIWCVLSASWSSDLTTTLSTAAGMAGAIVAAAALAIRTDVLTGARIICITTSVLAATSIAYRVIAGEAATVNPADVPPDQPRLAGSLAGIFWWNSDLGMVAGIAVTTSIAVALHSSQNAVRWSLLAGFDASVVYMTHSATAIISTTLATLVALMAFKANTRVTRNLKTLVVAGGMLALPYVWGVNVVALILGDLGKESTLTGRTFIWEASFRNFNQFAWTGTGLASFFESPYGRAVSARLGFAPGHVHNGFFQVVLELGVVGALFLLVSVLGTLVRLFRAIFRRESSFAPIVGVFIFFITANLANNYIAVPHLILVLYCWSSFVLRASTVPPEATSQRRALRLPPPSVSR